MDLAGLSRRKRAVFATLLVITSSLATAAVIELSLRALLPYYFSDDSRLANVPGLYRYRNAHADVLVEINRFGLRGPEPALRKVAGTVRVLALGDSTTWGEMLEFPDTYPEVAARILNETGPSRHEFLNLSRPGAGLREYLDYWRKAGTRFNPDIVVIGFFVGNDFYSVVNPYVLSPPRGGRLEQLRSRLRQLRRLIAFRVAAFHRLRLLSRGEPFDIMELWYGRGESRARLNPLHEQNLLRQAERMGLASDVVRRRLAKLPPDLLQQALRFDLEASLFAAAVLHPASPREALAMSDPKVLAACQAAMRVLDELIGEIRAAGATPVLLAIPRREQVAARYAADLETLGFELLLNASLARAPQEYLAEHATRAGVPFVDPLPALQEADRRGATLLYFPYDVHLTAAGNRVLGECLAREIAVLVAQRGDLRERSSQPLASGRYR